MHFSNQTPARHQKHVQNGNQSLISKFKNETHTAKENDITLKNKIKKTDTCTFFKTFHEESLSQ